jgi:hypothetical protein
MDAIEFYGVIVVVKWLKFLTSGHEPDSTDMGLWPDTHFKILKTQDECNTQGDTIKYRIQYHHVLYSSIDQYK